MGRRYTRRHLAEAHHIAGIPQWRIDAVVCIARGLIIIALDVVILSLITRIVKAQTIIAQAVGLATNLTVNCTAVALVMSGKGRMHWRGILREETGIGVERSRKLIKSSLHGIETASHGGLNLSLNHGLKAIVHLLEHVLGSSLRLAGLDHAASGSRNRASSNRNRASAAHVGTRRRSLLVLLLEHVILKQRHGSRRSSALAKGQLGLHEAIFVGRGEGI